MSWKDKHWPASTPRPKVARLDREALSRLHARVVEFVQGSIVLSELVQDVQLARGRIYFRREPEDLMARITPLGSRSMLLESQWGSSYKEQKKGQLATVLKALEGDTKGTFHGLGALVASSRTKKPSAQVVMYRELGIPIRVLAEPGYWYEKHRTPVIDEISEAKDRVLVRFESYSFSYGGFSGTCLYAQRGGEWGCYVLKPSASGTIETAVAWLEKRRWEDWS